MGDLQRRGDWRARLDAFFDTQMAKEFSETNHCGLLAADAIVAMTGVDLVTTYRNVPLKAAAKQIIKDGFKDHVDYVALFLEEIHPSEATLGDIVVFEAPDEFRFALGVCVGENSYVRREDQLGMVKTLTAKKAFRVP